ncbi:MAG: twin-arginine translocase subunit TatC [Proteobacteria bacterium]|nr:twin-arginine translocase subunit TatC [Pseudomonadota bacterium]
MITQSEDKKLPFREHLIELRQRIIKILITIGFFFIISFNYAKEILFFLTEPLKGFTGGGNLVYLKLTDGFFLFFKTSLIIALILSSPVLIYQIFMFMAPGLFEHEKRLLKIFILIGFLSFFTGFAFLYKLVLPLFLAFFSKFVFDFYEVYPNINDYIDFILKFNFYAGVLFTIPFAIFLMVHFRIIELNRLIELRKAFIILSFIISAIITPPDLLSQIIVSVIIIALFEMGLLIARIRTVLS